MRLAQLMLVFLYGFIVIPINSYATGPVFAISFCIAAGLICYGVILSFKINQRVSQFELIFMLISGVVASAFAADTMMVSKPSYHFLQVSTFVCFCIGHLVAFACNLLEKTNPTIKVDRQFAVVMIWITTFVYVMQLGGITGYLCYLGSGAIAGLLLWRFDPSPIDPNFALTSAIIMYVTLVLPIVIFYREGVWVNVAFFAVGTALLVSVVLWRYRLKAKSHLVMVA